MKDDFHSESVRMAQELAEATPPPSQHAQLRQLELEKLKAKAAKAQARKQRKVLNAVAHGPSWCLVLRAVVHWLAAISMCCVVSSGGLSLRCVLRSVCVCVLLQ